MSTLSKMSRPRPLQGMSQREYLRNKIKAAEQVVAPRPLADASMLTQIRRYQASAGAPNKTSDGQMVLPSSDYRLASIAGCAVCLSPPQATVTIPCCDVQVDQEAYVYQPTPQECCPIKGRPPQLATPKCCMDPGYVNTYKANNVPASGFLPPLPVLKPTVPCLPPPTTSCCTQDKVGIYGYDAVFWSEETLINEGVLRE